MVFASFSCEFSSESDNYEVISRLYILGIKKGSLTSLIRPWPFQQVSEIGIQQVAKWNS